MTSDNIDSDEPWADDDLDGVDDELVIQAYKLAQKYYATSTYGMDKIFLNALMKNNHECIELY